MLRLGREAAEERQCQPAVEERRQALVLELAGEALVGSDPLRTRHLVVDATGGAQHHERANHLGSGERQVEQVAATHRVAEPCRPAAHIGQQVGTARQVGRHRRRAAVAGRVDADHHVVPLEVLGHRAPAGTGLGEAVHEGQARPHPRLLRPQHPGMLP